MIVARISALAALVLAALGITGTSEQATVKAAIAAGASFVIAVHSLVEWLHHRTDAHAAVAVAVAQTATTRIPAPIDAAAVSEALSAMTPQLRQMYDAIKTVDATGGKPPQPQGQTGPLVPPIGASSAGPV